MILMPPVLVLVLVLGELCMLPTCRLVLDRLCPCNSVIRAHAISLVATSSTFSSLQSPSLPPPALSTLPPFITRHAERSASGNTC
ncbi:uncharacterized protein F4807DRAFT_112754 [Annulohypoxylon truncatum]|uniref:uncharacterized protein n=1 Tax=Annulohypoxylon truncatum TaxID=327061 RepID=UPI002007CA28|nr:uncharacterized protein F4807DRAFT_112754 [Annulohypoxylon truncatum]KAI1214060.1 hypothetical protein F4807DRAFT_112754 [Annulohypoxylon truncatum]